MNGHRTTINFAQLLSECCTLATIARVTTAGELNDSQRAALAEKLGKICGRAMSIHSEVDSWAMWLRLLRLLVLCQKSGGCGLLALLWLFILVALNAMRRDANKAAGSVPKKRWLRPHLHYWG